MPNWERNQEFRFIVPADYASLPTGEGDYRTISWFLISHAAQGVGAMPDPVHLTKNGHISASIQWPLVTGFNARNSFTYWVLDVSPDEPNDPVSPMSSGNDGHWRDGLALTGVTQSVWNNQCYIVYCAQARNINVTADSGVWTLQLKLHVTIDGTEYKFNCDPRMCVGGGCDRG